MSKQTLYYIIKVEIDSNLINEEKTIEYLSTEIPYNNPFNNDYNVQIENTELLEVTSNCPL